MTRAPEAMGWNRQYEAGRYKEEPLIPFVSTILENLTDEEKNGYGLYAGCGNGRNFIPLLEAGLDLRGIDISEVGIGQLIDKCPSAEGRVWKMDFTDYHSAGVFNYLVAIQVFQHGDRRQAHGYFQQSHDVLKPGGKFFLRVNSVSTEIKHRHKVIEVDQDGGLTVQYEEGPKDSMKIHFYSKQELEAIAANSGFEIVKALEDVVEPRHEQDDGVWAQWETIWQKR